MTAELAWTLLAQLAWVAPITLVWVVGAAAAALLLRDRPMVLACVLASAVMQLFAASLAVIRGVGLHLSWRLGWDSETITYAITASSAVITIAEVAVWVLLLVAVFGWRGAPETTELPEP